MTSDALPPLGDLDSLVGYHLRRASSVIGADFARAVGETGMRQALYGILCVVAASPGINQGAVGRALGIQRANMVSLINELVDRGWIEREAAAEDRRAFALALSAEGVRTLANAKARVVEHENHILAGLSDADRKTLIELLARIAGEG